MGGGVGVGWGLGASSSGEQRGTHGPGLADWLRSAGGHSTDLDAGKEQLKNLTDGQAPTAASVTSTRLHPRANSDSDTDTGASTTNHSSTSCAQVIPDNDPSDRRHCG
jgi:hypothetical protein